MLYDIQVSGDEPDGAAIEQPKSSVMSPRQEIGKVKPPSLTSSIAPSQTQSRKGAQASAALQPNAMTPALTIQEAEPRTLSRSSVLPEPNSVGQINDPHQNVSADRTQLSGQALSENQEIAAAQTVPDDGQGVDDTQRHSAIVGEITAVYRRYEDLRRARQRLELQAISTCRSVCGGDKVAGMKLYKAPTAEVELWLLPYGLAMQPLIEAIKVQEKLLTKLAKQLPVIEWADSVAGLSPRFLASIIGECGIGPGEYRSVSALWKRMGLAVIDGGRQRRVTGDAALVHGYVARRRALMWNIGESILKQQVRNPKGEDGKPTGDRTAVGYYGQVYIDRRAIEDTKWNTPGHAHNAAKRYVEKRLLRELWKAWRK